MKKQFISIVMAVIALAVSAQEKYNWEGLYEIGLNSNGWEVHVGRRGCRRPVSG